MTETYIRLLIDVEELQKTIVVRVLQYTIVDELIDTLVKNYSLSRNVDLCVAQGEHTLPLYKGRTLGQSGIKENNRLVLKSSRPTSKTIEIINDNVRYPFEDDFILLFEVESSGNRIPVRWQPAIIGRRDFDDARKNHLLAVDLYDEPNSNYVSRHHACLTRLNGQYFIEHISAGNKTFLNDRRLKRYERAQIVPGDRVTLQRVSIIFHLVEN